MEIINGYNRKCKDSVGGVRKVWLCKYVKYSRSQNRTKTRIYIKVVL